MKFSNVRELKIRTSELLEEVAAGEEIIITYHGKPRAMLVRINEGQFKVSGSDVSMLRDSTTTMTADTKQDRFLKLRGFVRTGESDWSTKHDEHLYGTLHDQGKQYGTRPPRGKKKKT